MASNSDDREGGLNDRGYFASRPADDFQGKKLIWMIETPEAIFEPDLRATLNPNLDANAADGTESNRIESSRQK